MPAVRSIVDPLGLAPRAARAGAAAADTAAATAIRVLDRALASPRTEEALDLVLSSPLVERAILKVADGPLVDTAVRAAIRAGLAERIAGELLDSGAVDRALDSPRTAELVSRLLDADQLWVVVDEIARSPAVTDAISHQSVGFAEQVADEVGQRSRRADAWLESRARRLLHRSPAPPDVVPPEPGVP